MIGWSVSYPAMGWTARNSGLIPSMARRIFSSPKFEDWLRGPMAAYSICSMVLIVGAEWPEHEMTTGLCPVTRLGISRIILPLPNDMQRDKFTFTFTYKQSTVPFEKLTVIQLDKSPTSYESCVDKSKPLFLILSNINPITILHGCTGFI